MRPTLGPHAEHQVGDKDGRSSPEVTCQHVMVSWAAWCIDDPASEWIGDHLLDAAKVRQVGYVHIVVPQHHEHTCSRQIASGPRQHVLADNVAVTPQPILLGYCGCSVLSDDPRIANTEDHAGICGHPPQILCPRC